MTTGNTTTSRRPARRAAALLAALLAAVAACGSGAGTGRARSQPSESAPATPGEALATREASGGGTVAEPSEGDDPGGAGMRIAGAPSQLVPSGIAAADDQLVVWGHEPDGRGAIALVDRDRLVEIDTTAPLPVCASAVSTGDGLVIVGNAPDDPATLDGFVVDPARSTLRSIPMPDALRGPCPGVTSTPGGFAAWVPAPGGDGPVVVATYDTRSADWTVLPTPPLPSDAYEVGGVWADDELILLAAAVESTTLLGASYDPASDAWVALPPAPVAPWESPQPIWSDPLVIVASSWPELLTGGEVDPFPEPLATGGAYDVATGAWRAADPAPPWTDGVAVSTGTEVLWWLPGAGHATVHDPHDDRWWRIRAPDSSGANPDPSAWVAVWDGTRIVATDGASVATFTPELDDVVALDPSGRPRPDGPLGEVEVGAGQRSGTLGEAEVGAGQRSGTLGLLGSACGVTGRNTIVVDVSPDRTFVLDFAIDREEPCGVTTSYEGSIAGSVDSATGELVGDGEALVDGRTATVRCACAVAADDRLVGELLVDESALFIVAFVDG